MSCNWTKILVWAVIIIIDTETIDSILNCLKLLWSEIVLWKLHCHFDNRIVSKLLLFCASDTIMGLKLQSGNFQVNICYTQRNS